jgi:hypothetical protein
MNAWSASKAKLNTAITRSGKAIGPKVMFVFWSSSIHEGLVIRQQIAKLLSWAIGNSC